MSATRLRLLSADDASADAALARDVEARALNAALAFLEALAGLPTPAWVACGRRLLDGGTILAEHSAARQALLSALWDRELSWPVWQVRDAVDTASCIVRSSGRPMGPEERGAFDVACAAACEAALAIFVRERLAAPELAALYSPFEPAVPLADGA
ncbi:MAG TPA: hypothetical protein VFT41_09640 [Gemmatimonadaceae bacterium]|nr:hypothetical protein [Gemmatimonadaceae bacterium]